MHPQVGRNLGKHKKVKILGSRKLKKSEEKIPIEKAESEFMCSKCSTVFQQREEFYVHVLECGGQTDWDVSKKKKKRKRVSVKKNNENSTENPGEDFRRENSNFMKNFKIRTLGRKFNFLEAIETNKVGAKI